MIAVIRVDASTQIDYQNYLEQKWVRKLRKKYPVSVQKEVLATVKPVEE